MAMIKTFKKLTLDKDTVMPTVTPLANGEGRKIGAQSASEYCSGMTSCSTFYGC